MQPDRSQPGVADDLPEPFRHRLGCERVAVGLALEQMADVLAEDERPLTASERDDMITLAARMQMDDRVPRVLRFCPER